MESRGSKPSSVQVLSFQVQSKPVELRYFLVLLRKLKKNLFYYSNGHVYGLLRRVKPSVLTRLKFRRYAYLCEHVFGKFPNMESCVSLAVSEV